MTYLGKEHISRKCPNVDTSTIKPQTPRLKLKITKQSSENQKSKQSKGALKEILATRRRSGTVESSVGGCFGHWIVCSKMGHQN